jgi:hypothetical protein
MHFVLRCVPMIAGRVVSSGCRLLLAPGPANRRTWLAAFLSGLVLSGCAIHPLPEDVAHVSTPNIVRQIRCEARQAVIDSLFRYLTSRANNSGTTREGKKLDDNSLAIGLELKKEYDEDPDAITRFDPARLTGFARVVVGLLYNTGIAYYYDLTGLETNNIDPAADFIRPVPVTSLVTLGLVGNFDRQRQNERSFTITDNFGDLVRKVHADYCTDHMAEANYVYPIAGKVGIDKVVHDFMLMTLFENLDAVSKDVTALKAGPPTMVDQLQFTTLIGGTATPKIVFIPKGPSFQFSDASFPVAASRKDIHQLTVGLYLNKTGAKEIGGVRMGLFQSQYITASGGAAERGAAAAVQQFLALKIFRPPS